MSFTNSTIIELNNHPELINIAAAWFHSKWSVPEQAYIDSITDALTSESGVPQWYIILNEKQEIIAS